MFELNLGKEKKTPLKYQTTIVVTVCGNELMGGIQMSEGN